MNGKIIGLLIGLFFGPLGLIIGFTLGWMYDRGLFDVFLSKHGFHRRTRGHNPTQQIFFDTTFAIMGFIAKSDGRVTEREIEAARKVMDQLGLKGAARERAIRQFYYGKGSDFDLDLTIAQLRHACLRHPTLLRTFIEIQVYMTNASGKINDAKRAALQRVCDRLGIRGFNFHQYEQQSRARQEYQHRYSNGHQQQQHYSSHSQIDDAYQILGVTRQATKDEIKKAYRRQMSQHHPDKLMAKGLPPEMIKVANEKTAQIKKAYDTIKRARGW